MADLPDRITVNPKQCGDRSCIRGMRIQVSDVLDLLAAGQSQSEILSTRVALLREASADRAHRECDPEAAEKAPEGLKDCSPGVSAGHTGRRHKVKVLMMKGVAIHVSPESCR